MFAIYPVFYQCDNRLFEHIVSVVAVGKKGGWTAVVHGPCCLCKEPLILPDHNAIDRKTKFQFTSLFVEMCFFFFFLPNWNGETNQFAGWSCKKNGFCKMYCWFHPDYLTWILYYYLVYCTTLLLPVLWSQILICWRRAHFILYFTKHLTLRRLPECRLIVTGWLNCDSRVVFCQLWGGGWVQQIAL